jgi:diaminopimelate decarboxylase
MNQKKLTTSKINQEIKDEFIRPYFKINTVENIPYEELAQKFGTPTYITVLDSVSERIECYKNTLRKFFPQSEVHYAMKANAAPPILNSVLRAGGSVDVVSAREAQLALASGFSPHHICFSGVGKTESEIMWALENNIQQINCEHLDEFKSVLLKIQFLAENQQIVVNTVVGLRINPCIEVNTHPHLLTGAISSKFGVLKEQFLSFLREQKKVQNRNFFRCFKALHVHVGSQLQAEEFFPKVVETLLDVSVECGKLDIPITILDLGGGLKVDQEKGWDKNHGDIVHTVSFQSQCLQQSAQKNKNWENLLEPIWGKNFENLNVIVEPGRSVVASSTVLLSKILYTKSNTSKVLIGICDAGMNDFPRPVIYNAKHSVFKVGRSLQKKDEFKTILSGPVCESACKLAELEENLDINSGDFVVFLEAGAYCFSMASHYNQRSIPAQVFFEAGKLKAHIEKKEAEIPKVIYH